MCDDQLERALNRLRERLVVGESASPPLIAHYDGREPLARWLDAIVAGAASDLDLFEGPARRVR